jgi:hypothetical protein
MSDVHRYRKQLRAVADDDELVVIVSDRTEQIFSWLIRKQGYVFAGDGVEPEWIDDLRGRGATHLYSISREFEQRPGMAERLGQPVLVAGEVRVYQLQ